MWYERVPSRIRRGRRMMTKAKETRSGEEAARISRAVLQHLGHHDHLSPEEAALIAEATAATCRPTPEEIKRLARQIVRGREGDEK